jgi:hypothetical protein
VSKSTLRGGGPKHCNIDFIKENVKNPRNNGGLLSPSNNNTQESLKERFEKI